MNTKIDMYILTYNNAINCYIIELHGMYIGRARTEKDAMSIINLHKTGELYPDIPKGNKTNVT